MGAEKKYFIVSIIYSLVSKGFINCLGRRNLNLWIEQVVTRGKLKEEERFVFMDILVFESVFYKWYIKRLLIFEIVLRLHQVHMRGDMVLHIFHISGTRMI